MVDALIGAAGAILSYFLGSFGSAKFFHPGLEEAFGAWKLLFAFLAFISIFLSQSKRGLVGIIIVGVMAAALFGWNYKSATAFPPFWSATDIAWFSFQCAQSAAVGVLLHVAIAIKDTIGKAKPGESDPKHAKPDT